ncbi:MAG: COG4223 family protein, partial [Alphaproteobacteria bacterium]
VVVFAVAIAGYFTLPMWRDKLPQYVQARLAGGATATIAVDNRVTAELTALRTQNDTLKAAVADLGKSLDDSRARLTAIDEIAARQSTGEKALEELRTELKSAPPPETPALDPQLVARLDALEKSMSGAVAAQSGQAAAGQKLDAGVAALTARIDALEAAVAELRKAATVSGRGDALALAAGQLRDALSRAAPFEAEIATLKNLAGANAAVAAAIAPVEKLAATGVPSRAAVLSRLPATVDAIVAATRTPDEGDWMDRTVSKLRGFVTVRRVDGKGAGPHAIVARAETAAGRGDLAVAVAEMSKLQGKAADASKVWLTDARARLAAEDARAALNRIVLNGLATSG